MEQHLNLQLSLSSHQITNTILKPTVENDEIKNEGRKNTVEDEKSPKYP